MQVLAVLYASVMDPGGRDAVYLLGERIWLGGVEGVTNLLLEVRPYGSEEEAVFIEPPVRWGYMPSIFVGDFNENGLSDLLLSIRTTPSGDAALHYIYGFEEEIPHLLFDSTLMSQQCACQVVYQDDYRVSVVSPEVEARYLINLTDKPITYLETVYQPDGKLRRHTFGSIAPIAGIKPKDIYFNKHYIFSTLQAVRGQDDTDVLGQLETYYRWCPMTQTFNPFMQYLLLAGVLL